ncbi:MAG: hypothetical protein R3E77_10165 [Steroidobacteraceae bacterium]
MKSVASARSAGQAMSECLAAMALLSPLFLAIVYIPKWQDARAQAEHAARFSAFDVALAPGIADEVRASRLANRLLPVPSGALRFDDATPGRGLAVPDPYWLAHDGVTPLKDGSNAARITLGESDLSGEAASAQRVFVAALRPVQTLAPERLDLAPEGGVVGTATVRLRAMPIAPPMPSSPLLDFSARHELLADSWGATHPREVYQRTRALMPVAPLRVVDRVVRPLTAVMAALEPSLRDFCIAPALPDVVPADRLGPRAAAPGGYWSPPC